MQLVRRYVAYSLSLRNLKEMTAERGTRMQNSVPLLIDRTPHRVLFVTHGGEQPVEVQRAAGLAPCGLHPMSKAIAGTYRVSIRSSHKPRWSPLSKSRSSISCELN